MEKNKGTTPFLCTRNLCFFSVPTNTSWSVSSSSPVSLRRARQQVTLDHIKEESDSVKDELKHAYELRPRTAKTRWAPASPLPSRAGSPVPGMLCEERGKGATEKASPTPSEETYLTTKLKELPQSSQRPSQSMDLKDLNKLAKNISKFNPGMPGCQDVQAYLKDIDFHLEMRGNGTDKEKLYLLRMTSNPEAGTRPKQTVGMEHGENNAHLDATGRNPTLIELKLNPHQNKRYHSSPSQLNNSITHTTDHSSPSQLPAADTAQVPESAVLVICHSPEEHQIILPISSQTPVPQLLGDLIERGIARKFYLSIIIERHIKVEALLDTGADITLMSTKLLEEIQERTKGTNATLRLQRCELNLQAYSHTEMGTITSKSI
ncbi:hypothetical protein QQF64_027192 [Cirrhinus molitorella]|uniref:Peptidase A2 domain-containing protein n=1 Tax=Cirrhinus molitorella TaxID=172907 RepID=A0ABR3NBR2_9TELE